MSGLSLALGRARPAKSKKKAKSRRAAVSTEYSLLLTATLCLLAFGAVMVFSASSTTQVLQNGGLADSAYYLQRTLVVGAIGLVVMHFTARYGLGSIRRLTPVFLAGSMFLLVVVLGAGQSVNGATRWIGSGSFQIQPSELAKVALVLYAADLLAREPKRIRSIKGVHADPAGDRRRLPVDLAAARHGDDDGRRLRGRRDPDRGRRRPP